MSIATLPKLRARSPKPQRRRSTQELAEITGGAVTGINQVARLQRGCSEQGCAVEKLDKKAIEKLLLDPEICRHRCGGCWSCGSAVLRQR